MKITILGAGVGASHFTKTNINCLPPAFLVEWEDQKLLFDCSQAVDIRLEKMGIDYASIHYVAISHPHPDHCAPIHFLQSVYLKGLWGGDIYKNNELTFFGPDYLIENFQTMWDMYVHDKKGAYLDWPHIQLLSMSDGKKHHSIGNGTITAQKVYHAFGKCDTVSYRLETPEGIVSYSGDTGDCEGIRTVSKNVDLFICEASAPTTDPSAPTQYGHLNPFTAGIIAKETGVKKLLLFHYTGLESDEIILNDVKRSGFLGEIILAKDFTTLSL